MLPHAVDTITSAEAPRAPPLIVLRYGTRRPVCMVEMTERARMCGLWYGGERLCAVQLLHRLHGRLHALAMSGCEVRVLWSFGTGLLERR